MNFNDSSLMPFGKYEGIELEKVPASYLLWLYDKGLNHQDLKEYIEDNMEVLKKEINEKKD